MQSHNDFANYVKMSQPFEDQGTAAQAINDFLDAVASARQAHRITDVVVIVRCASSDGVVISSAHFGNSLESEGMLAYALGKETERRREAIARMLRGTHRDQG